MLWGFLAGPLRAQISGVQMQVPQEMVGLGGYVRPGTWAPIRVTLNSPGDLNRPVLVQWRLSDHDGDQVIAERRATLNPNRDQHVWLYAVPPVNTPANQAWTLQVLDADSGELLATQVVVAARRESPRLSVIGVAGAAGLGLDPYKHQYTQHEPIGILHGLDLETMPDRWYGFDLLHSLIWVSDGGDPNAAMISGPMQAALKEWVRRGGHLVIVMPAFAEPWTSSAFADLLPVAPEAVRRVQGPLPGFLYDVRPPEPVELQMTVFDVPASSDTAVLQRLDGGEPVIVARRYGFGRVTLIGVDLNDPRLKRLNLPTGAFRVWNTVYGWNSPVIDEKKAQADMQDGKLTRPENRMPSELGSFVPGQIAMTNQAAPVLLLAILVFVLYWLAAGPIGFAVLKGRGKTRKSWLVFCGTVGVFTAITWGGAWVLQPRGTSLAHFSVLDIDAKTGLVRTQSWLSVFIPEFGRAHVTLAPGEESDTLHNTLWSPGLLEQVQSTSFPDPQLYIMDAGSPNEVGAGAKLDRTWPVGLPVRATAKQFNLHYLGAIGEGVQGITAPWVPPQGELRVQDRFPYGTLSHNLPGELKNVLAVYVPQVVPDPDESAEAARRRAVPFVWRIGAWAPMTPLQFQSPNEARITWDWLTQRPPNYQTQRSLNTEGFLGILMSGSPQTLADQDLLAVRLATDQKVKFIEMLSFYDALPPPNVYQSTWGSLGPTVYQRSLGRGLDLTPHTVGAKLILIGHLESSPLPAPLLVDGEPVESTGWTVVRWIYDL